MVTTAITPPAFESYYRDWRMSPGLAVDGFIFLTGFTGGQFDGSISSVPETQIHEAFRNVQKVLEHRGLSFADVVEMTTYHVNLHEHLAVFRKVHEKFVEEPYPAWTAIEVVGLVEIRAIVEIRVIARE